ncbi:TOMM precursor leader peptide-binding protein [Pendulispora albinea]|uniref:TOMM leader peptide-binding protein n=1 Tax=Pendulispora albinea TaxID=2741071 RepID=A0ABZ2M3K1_9BACT
MTTYRMSQRLSCHDDGSSVYFYWPAEARGTALRGLAAELFRALRPVLQGDSVARATLVGALAHLVDAERALELITMLNDKEVLVVDDGAGPKLTSLSEKRIALTGSARLIDPVVIHLASFGARDLALEEPLLATPNGVRVTPTNLENGDLASLDLIALLDDRLNIRRHRELNAAAIAAKTKFVSMRLFGSSFEMGPLVLPGKTACFECFWHRLQAREEEHGPPKWFTEMTKPPIATSEGPTAEALYQIAAAHIALEIRRCLTRETVPISMGRVVEHDVAAPRLEVHRVLEVPGCQACGAADVP